MSKNSKKVINLALQGGGAHGAFGWGILDYLLEDNRIHFEGISATSAGAANAVVLAQGLLNNDNDEARAVLHDFWKSVSQQGFSLSAFDPFSLFTMSRTGEQYGLENSFFYNAFDIMTKVMSPYQFNPFNINPLRQILEEKVNFSQINEHSKMKIFLCATNIETCKIRIFTNESLTVDSVLASACLPFLFQSVEIEGEYYWDGGYIGNPAIFPLIYNCDSRDVVIVHINPIIRKGVPTTPADILNRVNEVSFNSSLMREMRAIYFVSKLIETHSIEPSKMKHMLIHCIRADDEMSKYNVSSKMNTNWNFLLHLRDQGRLAAKDWLASNFDKIGNESSIDISKEFM